MLLNVVCVFAVNGLFDVHCTRVQTEVQHFLRYWTTVSVFLLCDASASRHEFRGECCRILS